RPSRFDAEPTVVLRAREFRMGLGRSGRRRLSTIPFNVDHQRSLKRETINHLGSLDFVAARENVVFLGPPGTGKTHLSIGLGVRAARAGHGVACPTAAKGVPRRAEPHPAGSCLTRHSTT